VRGACAWSADLFEEELQLGLVVDALDAQRELARLLLRHRA
jgi:hypothetical protein